MPSAARLKSALDITSTVLVSVAAGVVIWAVVQNRLSAPAAGANRSLVESVDGLRIEADAVTNVRGGGNVALIEFGDYECTFCARHARETSPAIQRELIDSGQIRHAFFHFPIERLHPNAMKASEAAECAGRQGAYWKMHERLFSEPLGLAPATLIRNAEALSLDREPFERCLNGETTAIVRAHMEEGRRLRVTATPTFFVGTVQPDGAIQVVARINGAAPLDQFQSALGKLLKSGRDRR
jgi:protein-disulfide isomerase